MKIVREFILRDIAGEYILVPTGATTDFFNGMITISESAKFIWENIEKTESLDELVKMMLEEYNIDEKTARQDCMEFVAQLLGAGFVECTREDKRW